MNSPESGRVARKVGLLTTLCLMILVSVAVAGAGLTVGTLINVSPGPGVAFPTGCNGSQSGKFFPDAELEPYVAVDPSNPMKLIGVWQQDRYSNGGSKGLRTAFSTDGGQSWTIATPPTFSVCAGGTAQNGGDYLRASDPWVSIAPNGTAYQVSLSVTLANTPSGNPVAATAVLVSKSTDGGANWGPPTTIIRDTDPTVFNDKESITADSTNASLAYIVWDRLVSPSQPASFTGFEHAIGFHGPTWFSRTTNGGSSWEAPRIIFDPGGQDQTIGNEIVVLPDGTLVDGFNLILKQGNPRSVPDFFVALIRSTDKGLTWSKPIIVSPLMAYPTGTANGVFDPNTGERLRTGDIIPQFAVDHASGALYVVWQDTRFSGGTHDDIAFSMSTDGGLTWSTPVKINQTPGTNTSGLSNIPAFTPSVVVAPDGSVGVTYYDVRNLLLGDTTTLPTDAWILNCLTGCTDPANWAEQHLAGPFDMKQAAVARGFFVGDYEGLAAAQTGSNVVFHPFFAMSNGIAVSTSGPSDIFTATAETPAVGQ